MMARPFAQAAAHFSPLCPRKQNQSFWLEPLRMKRFSTARAT